MTAKIRQIRKAEMSTEYVISVERFYGLNKTVVPKENMKQSPLSLKLLAMQVLSRRSFDRDFQFLNQITSSNVCSEWNGYNTFLNRTEGHAIRPRTTSVYAPLIDMKPTDPDTMLTTMIQAEKLATGAGQSVVLLTCDQQLYPVQNNS